VRPANDGLKGNFHCNKPENGSDWVPERRSTSTASPVDSPEAGADQEIPEEARRGLYDNRRAVNEIQ